MIIAITRKYNIILQQRRTPEPIMSLHRKCLRMAYTIIPAHLSNFIATRVYYIQCSFDVAYTSNCRGIHHDKNPRDRHRTPILKFGQNRRRRHGL